MKKLFASLVCCTLVFGLVGCGGSSSSSSGDEVEVKQLKLATQYPEDHNDAQSVIRASEAIQEATGGSVEIKVYPANQLGDYTQVFEEVMKGTIDMATISIPTQFDSRLEMLTVPYLVTSYDQAKTTFADGSYVYTELQSILNELDVEMLNIYLDGFMGIGATESIENVMDFSTSHPQLLRVPSMDSLIWTAQGMGFNTTTIAYADLYSALQTGVADGWLGGSAYVNQTSFGDVIEYFADNRYIHELVVTIVNKDTFESLTEEEQSIIKETFAAEALVVADLREVLDDQALVDMEAAGIEVYVPTEEELAAAADYFRADVWPKFESVLGTELMEGLIANAD
ncbi:TRAP transporter substrate-binding protein DctP [Chakrabartyella piscis]|uniref:TRAP transporter substrate-binding protein DctP n=1 Tax=Chakrabartyella piscis TaxID=2918914 RepID=UPI0029585B56|nr:TRAP transporter substrate-binding protein DctP [Chakrabartyella piscis]